jgi:hypothetical protein
MANLLFKLGRWATIGTLAAAGGAACGGRGNLPLGAFSDDEDGGSSFGGSAGQGGTRNVAGSTSAGATSGSSNGGNVSVAGSVSIGGTSVGGGGFGCGAGAPCQAPFACHAGRCLIERFCRPGQESCDANGQLLLRCVADGSGYEGIDCLAQGQLCRDGACRSLMCAPGKPFCDDNTLWLCNMNGSGAAVKQTCASGQYCDPVSLSCQAGVCSPNQPACKGELATLCNQAGSGYLAGGTDCSALPDRHCYLGSCLCEPNRADCDGIDENGCEANVVSDASDCGGCGIVCSASHMATRTCNGTCNGTCQAGYADCNGDKQTDGCETALETDAASCGSCGVECSDNHVVPSCTSGGCNGKCSTNFRDCNLDKQSDGCESDSRTDVDNCGACGVECSGNHVERLCVSRKCSGACTTGFADCNADKQADGCEVDTRSDEQNCGGCGNQCAVGESCTNGSCSALLTFSGIKQDLPMAALSGWQECFSDFYGQQELLSTVLQACTGSKLMMACRKAGSDTLQLAAYAPIADVMFDTGKGDVPHNANGVGWYFNESQSWGFAPEGDPIHRYTCDIVDSALEDQGVDGDKRLCWHTSTNYVSSGWRCGRNDLLNSDLNYERVLFTAP